MKTPGPGGFTGKFYQISKKKQDEFYTTFSTKIRDEVLPKPFHHVDITSISFIQNQYKKKRKLETNTAHEHRCKNPQKQLSSKSHIYMSGQRQR